MITITHKQLNARQLVWLGLALCVAATAQASGEGPKLSGDDEYRITTADPDELILSPPKLPDLSRYSAAAVTNRMPARTAPRVAIRRMVDLDALEEFVGRDGRLRIWASRQRVLPVAIVVEEGLATARDIARSVDDHHLEQIEAGVFVARVPVVVQQGATLHLDQSVRDFRLSREGGAFLINDGKLFITDTRLRGWSEAEAAPARFRDPYEFRPFLTSWGGAELYVVNAEISHLGYSASKSYGLSVSQYSPGQHERMQRPAPQAWILDSRFSELWYGFYCYEAKDLVIARNNYHDNIVYGIDPHDRSTGLIIAENVTSGTRKKHGLIISREVNDSWIFRNRSYDNALSGIMIDRQSTGNVIADNLSHSNGADGITIYESPNNLLWKNRVVSNGTHGIRVRNSVNIRLYHNQVVANGYSGIYGHIKDLTGTDRDTELDPFNPYISMVVVGGQLVSNGSGPLAIDQPLSLELYNVRMLAPASSTGIQMRGALGHHQNKILDLLIRERKAVIIEPDDGTPVTVAGEAGS